MNDDLDAYLAERFKDPEFCKAYEQAQLHTLEFQKQVEKITDKYDHKISMVCSDYFTAHQQWVAMCSCGKYASKKMKTAVLAGDRAYAHVLAARKNDSKEKS
jgi:hypothetical protein